LIGLLGLLGLLGLRGLRGLAGLLADEMGIRDGDVEKNLGDVNPASIAARSVLLVGVLHSVDLRGIFEGNFDGDTERV
jgi:hypothetical protein